MLKMPAIALFFVAIADKVQKYGTCACARALYRIWLHVPSNRTTPTSTAVH